MTPAARVTVGMPVFNNARTLGRAIASVRGQGLADWRLIISDDGSTDGSREIAKAAAAEDARIRLLCQPARLGFMNFRAPLDLADTPCFVWLAGDDHWHPDFLHLTLAALEAAPSALSALPQAAFIGPPEHPVPNLDFLRGDATERVRRFLAHPGGTRMYGLMRTEAARSAFPPRPFNAWDWYLMSALLAQGPQLSLPQQLIFREETPWFRYAQMVDGLTDRWLYRRFPVLEMSLQLIRDRRLPRGVLRALWWLNLRKHAEYVAVNQPATFARRRWFYRRLKLPIALRQTGTAAPPVLPAATAILTFRNAARTLPAALDHLRALGCAVVAIDHGSTDESRAIVEQHLGTEGGRIVDAPWTGTFDLQAQLALKRKIIGSLGGGWVLHADADEFIDPPKGRRLADCLAEADRQGRIAFPVEEHLFVPRLEEEEHDPDRFPATMKAHVRMQEHNPKQRLFRADADLGLWMRSGGHTVTRDTARLARPALVLRHYPGLSLDDLRAQYLSRVFSPRDRARAWHANRTAARAFDIVEPDPALFAAAELATVRSLPFFAPRPCTGSPALPTGADLYLLEDDGGTDFPARIHAALPGLRTAVVPVEALWSMRRSLPVLIVLRHPATIHGHGVRRSEERARAVDWTRRIAQARQWAVNRGAIYAEIRSEDLVLRPEILRDLLPRLFRSPVVRGSGGFVPADLPVISRHPYESPVRTITAPLAADLGYR